MDNSRKFDLEYLNKEYNKTNSLGMKLKIEKLINDILNEHPTFGKIRQMLVKAVRNNDTYSIHRFSQQINNLKHKQLNGRQF